MSTIIRKRGQIFGSFDGKREFIAKVRDCQELARQRFPEFTLSDAELPIVFFAKGSCAGWAKYKRSGSDTIYNIEFNLSNIKNHWNSMVEDTIPHEISHIVDRFINGRSSGHGHPWKRIARVLGCSGDRTHNFTVEKARKTRKYIYTATCGTEIGMSSQRHTKINRGVVFTVKATGGKITHLGFTGKVVRS